MKVAKKMSRNVIYFYPDEPIEFAYKIMKHVGVRHLPVVDDEKVVGVISDRDIFKYATLKDGELKLPNLKLRDIMSEDLITLLASESVASAASCMIEYKIDCLPIVDEKQGLVGILTSTDLLELLISGDFDEIRHIPFDWELKSYRQVAAGI